MEYVFSTIVNKKEDAERYLRNIKIPILKTNGTIDVCVGYISFSHANYSSAGNMFKIVAPLFIFKESDFKEPVYILDPEFIGNFDEDMTLPLKNIKAFCISSEDKMKIKPLWWLIRVGKE